MKQSNAESVFSELELRQYDGQGGRPAYIAYDGIIYDVTDSKLWRRGMPKDLHYSGLDLTRSLRKAPHGDWVFERMTRVGVMID